MNEEGKSTVQFYIFVLSLFFLGSFMYRYFEMTGSYPTNDEVKAFMLSAEFSEYFFLFIMCAWVLGAVHGLSYFVVNIVVYSVYFFQRAWYLHKLRKPVRVYTGDPL